MPNITITTAISSHSQMQSRTEISQILNSARQHNEQVDSILGGVEGIRLQDEDSAPTISNGRNGGIFVSVSANSNPQDAAQLVMIAAAANNAMPELRHIDPSLIGFTQLVDSTGNFESIVAADNPRLLESYREISTEILGRFSTSLEAIRDFFTTRSQDSETDRPSIILPVESIRYLHPSHVTSEEIITLRNEVTRTQNEHSVVQQNEAARTAGQAFLPLQNGLDLTATQINLTHATQQFNRLELSIVDRLALTFLDNNTALLRPLEPSQGMLDAAHMHEVSMLAGLVTELE